MNLKPKNRCWCVFCWLTAGLALCILATSLSQADAAEATQATKAAGAENANIEKTVEKDGVRLTMQLDRDQAEVADPVGLELRIEAPEGVKITPPNLPAQVGNLQVRQTVNQADVPAGKTRLWIQKYEIESFVPGSVELPPIKIAYQPSAGNQSGQQLELPAVPLSIGSLVGADTDPTQFRDIKGTVEIPTPATRFPTWGWYVLGVTAVVGLGLWARWRWNRKPLTADQWALAELDRINVRSMIEQGRVQELYFLVTGIVRTYIERRFGIHAPKKTTAEFLSEAQHHPLLGGMQQASLGEFLEAADRVKFARWTPDASQNDAAVAGAKWFVETTAESADGNPALKRGQKQTESQFPLARASG